MQVPLKSRGDLGGISTSFDKLQANRPALVACFDTRVRLSAFACVCVCLTPTRRERGAQHETQAPTLLSRA
jgi:hypothetical protein